MLAGLLVVGSSMGFGAVAMWQKWQADRNHSAMLESQQETELRSYAANIDSANLRLVINDLERMRGKLDGCPAHLRRWEWHWLKSNSDTSLRVLRHSAASQLTYSRNGTTLIAAGSFELAAWDTTHYSNLWTASAMDSERGIAFATWGTAHGISVPMVSTTSDGSVIATAHNNNVLRIWNGRDGTTEEPILHGTSGEHMNGGGVAIHPDGTTVATWSSGKDLVLRDAKSGTRSWELGHNGLEVTWASFSPDGTTIATATLPRQARCTSGTWPSVASPARSRMRETVRIRQSTILSTVLMATA